MFRKDFAWHLSWFGGIHYLAVSWRVLTQLLGLSDLLTGTAGCTLPVLQSVCMLGTALWQPQLSEEECGDEGWVFEVLCVRCQLRAACGAWLCSEKAQSCYSSLLPLQQGMWPGLAALSAFSMLCSHCKTKRTTSQNKNNQGREAAQGFPWAACFNGAVPALHSACWVGSAGEGWAFCSSCEWGLTSGGVLCVYSLCIEFLWISVAAGIGGLLTVIPIILITSIN